VQTVRRLIDVVNAGDAPEGLVTDDVELTNATTAVTEATYRGLDGALKWRRDMFDVVEDARYQLDEVIASGPDHVVIANSIVGQGRGSGVPVDMRWTSVFWFDADGKIWKAAGFNTRAAAMAAVR
jgi:ketosteroid isomerase-like protein